MSASNPAPINRSLSSAQSPALRTLTSTRSRCSSFLPIPTPRKTSFSISSPKSVASSISQSSLSLAYEKSKLKPINTKPSNAATRSTSVSHAKPRGSIARSAGLTGNQVFPPNSLKSHHSTRNNPPQKPTQLPSSLGATRKPTDDLSADEQAGQSCITSPAAVPHSLRRVSRVPRQDILNHNRTHLLSTKSLFTAEPPHTAGRRSIRSNAAPSQFIHQQPLNRGLTPPHQVRRAKSQQDILAKSRATQSPIANAQLSTPVKQNSTHSESNSTSPESTQSKITLTDGDSSIRTRTDGDSSIRTRFSHAHEPNSSSSSNFDQCSKIVSTNNSNGIRRAADVLMPLPNSDDLPLISDYRVPLESQSRFLVLEKLKPFILGGQSHQAHINYQAVHRLICQSELYETLSDIEKRVFENSITLIPQATLEVPTQLTPTLNYASATTTPFIWATQSNSYGISPTKKLHVGAIILEKLRRVSKGGPGQSFKHGPSKSISKSVKVSSLPMSHHSHKTKNGNSSIHIVKTTNSDQKRFSQILGAGLERMNHSTCVVTMGERLHILPTLPFSVIEEIYRRGMRTPGILRISGDFTRIDELVNAFELCPSSGIDLSSEDIHTVCGLLKYYLRSLPQPLFHPLLSEIFWTSCVKPARNKNAQLEQSTTEFIIARYLLQLIPSRSLSLLAYVIPFLAHVPTFSENRIQDESLATMLGPAIFIDRNIGFPGLGVYPRSLKISRPAIGQSATGQLDNDLSTLKPGQTEKKEATERATESTLWMMNHWKLLFSEVYSVGDSKPEAVDLAEPRMNEHEVPLSAPPQNTHLQDDTRSLDHEHSHAMFTAKFNYSRPSSILTYSSGVTGSQRSTMHEDSMKVLSSKTYPVSGRQTDELDKLESASSQEIDRSDAERDLKQAQMDPSLKIDFPRLSESQEVVDPCKRKDQTESSKSPFSKEEKERQPRHSTLTLFKHSAQEDEHKERRNSERLTKILADYIEGREEKIIQQESIIESLVEEIGRLTTVEEVQEMDKRNKLLERIKSPSNPLRKSTDQPFNEIKDFLNTIDQQDPNVISNPSSSNICNTRHTHKGSESSLKSLNQSVSNHTIESKLESHSENPSDYSSKSKFDENLHSYNAEQTSNFEEIDEDDSSTEHGEEDGDPTVQVTSNKSNIPSKDNSQTSNNETRQHAFGQPNSQEEPLESLKDDIDHDTTYTRFDTQRSHFSTKHASVDTIRLSVDSKHLSSTSSSSSFMCGGNRSTFMCGGNSSSFMCGGNSSFMCDGSSFMCGGQNEAGLKAEIDRLKSINSKLILKLKSIEDIVSTHISDIIL